MLNVVADSASGEGCRVAVSPAIDEIVREGAQQMSAAALRAPVAAAELR
jgi:hypothetical protein